MIEYCESVGRAIADRSRIRILKMLEPGELCVCQVTAILGLAPATVSKHLSMLKLAGLVIQRKEGRWVYYRLAATSPNPCAEPVLEMLHTALDADPTIQEDRRRLDYVHSIAVKDLLAMGPGVFEEGVPAARTGG